jgi:diadenosine tetraphosphate (Ap4A) HIT family hydrolase
MNIELARSVFRRHWHWMPRFRGTFEMGGKVYKVAPYSAYKTVTPRTKPALEAEP